MGDFEDIFGAGADINAIIASYAPDYKTYRKQKIRDIDALAQPQNSTKEALNHYHMDIWSPNACPWLRWFVRNPGHPFWDDQINYEFVVVLNTIFAASLRNDESFAVLLISNLVNPEDPYIPDNCDPYPISIYTGFRPEISRKMKSWKGAGYNSPWVSEEREVREAEIIKLLNFLPTKEILPSVYGDTHGQLIDMYFSASDFSSRQRVRAKYYFPDMLYALGATEEEISHAESILISP